MARLTFMRSGLALASLLAVVDGFGLGLDLGFAFELGLDVGQVFFVG